MEWEEQGGAGGEAGRGKGGMGRGGREGKRGMHVYTLYHNDSSRKLAYTHIEYSNRSPGMS